ncbi:lipopolysaccharide kinase InaA family protein [Seonamhaeicola sp.]|uniref:lipopolysaccharide kinase InaA family protein n=1 Tax=Seonamhaeicola sp. TaxID=1912245 RepID=UPI002622CCD9|nr:lipopolysaccharide kinase InaA family protein [Seonamhaeicola sp.]
MFNEVHGDYLDIEDKLLSIINNFESEGEIFISGRNTIKLFKVNDLVINVKAFKVPNLINQIAYNFFRKSKAQRSFEYANKLLEMHIGTPKPLAYFEFKSRLLFKQSFYVTEHLDCDYTYRDLIKDFDIPGHQKILEAFTRFTFSLHEKGIHFLDHSAGNTLIKGQGGTYEFYLVDLNRMRFVPMDFEARIKNFSRLTPHRSMVEVMSREYAKCSGEDYDKVFKLMWKETEDYQKKYHRKRRLKRKLKFWKQ